MAIALFGAVGWAFTDPAGHRAMLTSAGLAILVQMVAFALARALVRKNLLLGWGLGSVLRLVALVGYALLQAKAWHGPLVPALLSFVAFLLVTTLFEPVFLRR